MGGVERTRFSEPGGRERWGGVTSYVDSDQFPKTFLPLTNGSKRVYVRIKRLFASNTCNYFVGV